MCGLTAKILKTVTLTVKRIKLFNRYFFVFNRVKPHVAIRINLREKLSTTLKLVPLREVKTYYCISAFERECVKFYDLLKIIVIFKMN